MLFAIEITSCVAKPDVIALVSHYIARAHPRPIIDESVRAIDNTMLHKYDSSFIFLLSTFSRYPMHGQNIAILCLHFMGFSRISMMLTHS